MDGPLFTALATSTRQIFLLLRCIAFTSRADVYITTDGLRFSTEESHAIQASTLLEKNLFTSYNVRLPQDQPVIPPFKINIHAFLETLQIFGVAEASSNYKNQNGGISSSYATAFTTPALGIGGTCRLSYAQVGAPLCITIDEGGVNTTCEMNTYELSNLYDGDAEIPLDRSTLVMKIIMPSTWLHDAVAELSGTYPETLTVNASSISAPFFCLEGQGGPFGDSTVDFMPDSKPDPTSGTSKGKKQPQVTETFTVSAPSGTHGRIKQSYRFDLVKRAGRAMALASKVSIRQDKQGVLSLQFMCETVDAHSNAPDPGTFSLSSNMRSGQFAFIDFRFVPLLDEEDGSEGEAEANTSTQSEE